MTTYKCKLKISRLERETYLSRTENHIFALKSSTNNKTSLGSAKLVKTNSFLRLIQIFAVPFTFEWNWKTFILELKVLQPRPCHQWYTNFCDNSMEPNVIVHWNKSLFLCIILVTTNKTARFYYLLFTNKENKTHHMSIKMYRFYLV